MKIFYLLTGILVFGIANAQQTTLKVVGKNLTKLNGESITLRGINYPIIDEGTISLANAAQYQHKIDQAALTGANAIRLPWYTDGTHWRDNPDYGAPGTINGYVSNGHLSNLIGYCHQKGMIPILEIHNITCSNYWPAFNLIAMPWWKSQPVLDLIETHKEYLVINLANEFGQVRWTGNTASALVTFQTNYANAITDLRNLGVDVPIMIDAPDCGQSSTELLSIAESMVTNDPEHNLIFSAHAYWYGYAQTLAAVQTKLDEAENTDVCFILGEIANTQDGDSCGSLSLASLYPIILNEACSRNIGWLAWTYDQDCSSPREMTANGEFNTLTAYGSDLVYNATYGLLAATPCGAQLANPVFEPAGQLVLYPNPARQSFGFSKPGTIVSAAIYDLSGRIVKQIGSGFETISISELQSGNYIVKVRNADLSTQTTKLVKI